jgi:hypothetical protein
LKKALVIILVIAAALLAGCSAGTPDATPEGAYRAFIKALLDKDYEGLYACLDKSTQDVLKDSAGALLRLDKLPQAPRNLPGGEDRAVLTKAAKSEAPYRSLLGAYFTAHPLSYNEEQKRGSEPDKSEIKGDTAIVTTRGGEEIKLVREADGWKVTSLHTILTGLKDQIDATIEKAAVPPKPAETPEEAFAALVNTLKSGNYDSLYFMLDAETRKGLDNLAKMSQKIAKAVEDNPGNTELVGFWQSHNYLKAARNGREVLVAVMMRYQKPGGIDIAGATLATPETAAVGKTHAAPATLPQGDVVTLTTAAGEHVRFIKETTGDATGWHTDFLQGMVKNACDDFQPWADKV